MGDTDVVLRVISEAGRFAVLPLDAQEPDFFRILFPDFPERDGMALASLPLGDGLQKMCFETDETLEKALSEVSPKHYILPVSYLMARFATAHSRRQSQMVIFDAGSQIQVFLARGGKLCFANLFDCASLEEKRYFSLAVKQEFGPCDRCLTVGESQAPEDLSEGLKPYFKGLETCHLCEDKARRFLENISDEII